MKNNLIYGENGSGKTTIVLILSPLKGNNHLVAKKRAFDRTVGQTIEVLTNSSTNPKLTFNISVWDNHYRNLEIFDIHFIKYLHWFRIQTSHKKNLFKVTFGSRGITLKTEIQFIKDGTQNGNKFVKETSEKIELAIEMLFLRKSLPIFQLIRYSKYHHRHNTKADSKPVTDAELRNYCDRTLALIH